MKQRRISILLILMSLQFTNMLLYGQKQEKILIESKEMAIKISDIILKSVYNGNTHNLKHFNIALEDSVWIVTNETKQNNRLCLQFSAKDCQILSDIPDNWSIDETSALKIAEIIWKSIYGKSILRKKPFMATLQDNIWLIKGTLPNQVVGGVPYISISQNDCQIKRVWHTK